MGRINKRRKRVFRISKSTRSKNDMVGCFMKEVNMDKPTLEEIKQEAMENDLRDSLEWNEYIKTIEYYNEKKQEQTDYISIQEYNDYLEREPNKIDSLSEDFLDLLHELDPNNYEPFEIYFNSLWAKMTMDERKELKYDLYEARDKEDFNDDLIDILEEIERLKGIEVIV